MNVRKIWFTLSVIVCFAISGWGQTHQTLTVEQTNAGISQLRIGNTWVLNADDKLAEYIYAACLTYFRASNENNYRGFITSNDVLPYSGTKSTVTIYYENNQKRRYIKFSVTDPSPRNITVSVKLVSAEVEFEIPEIQNFEQEKFYDQAMALIVNALPAELVPNGSLLSRKIEINVTGNKLNGVTVLDETQPY